MAASTDQQRTIADLRQRIDTLHDANTLILQRLTDVESALDQIKTYGLRAMRNANAIVRQADTALEGRLAEFADESVDPA